MSAYKDKERGTWFCKFTYTDETGARRQKKKRGFKTRKEALDWERLYLLNTGDTCPVTFEELLDAYLMDLESRCRETTLTTKRYVLETRILPYFGNKKLEDISPADIRRWQNILLKQKYKPTYLRFINTQMSAIMNYAVSFYGLKSNPCKKAGQIGKAKPREMNFWTEDEFSSFIETVDIPKYRMLFQVLYWTGIREGEALALTPRDINFKARTIDISKTYVKLPGGTELLNPPKTEGSNRTVAIPEFLAKELKTYIETGGNITTEDAAGDGDSECNGRNEGNGGDRGNGRSECIKGNERLFKVAKTSLRDAMLKYCEKSGVKVIRIHDIRHSHASLLIELGTSPKLIAARLGHDNVQTTLNIYAHLYPSAQEEIADTLQGLYLKGEA